ncbi:MAG: hypothetical protein A2Z49_12840 [Chloroflexi bacterium RBG_19FT_COMBO_56_12]|nr:MAG: hypothetical protein A2Z49_12840 [Chloroflexi bacterium RBG_19FT_COMBO_56_12]
MVGIGEVYGARSHLTALHASVFLGFRFVELVGKHAITGTRLSVAGGTVGRVKLLTFFQILGGGIGLPGQRYQVP